MGQHLKDAEYALLDYKKVVEFQIKDANDFAERAALDFDLYVQVRLVPNIKQPIAAVLRQTSTDVTDGQLKTSLDEDGAVWIPWNWFDGKDNHKPLLVQVQLKGQAATVETKAILRTDNKEKPKFRYFLSESAWTSLTKIDRGRVEELIRQYCDSNGEYPFSTTHPAKQKGDEKGDDNTKPDGDNLADFLEAKCVPSKCPLWVQMDGRNSKSLKMYPAVNTYELEQQKRAISYFQYSPAQHHHGLLNVFANPRNMQASFMQHQATTSQINEKEWKVLTDAIRCGASQQREFVGKALSTPDIAVMEGPPGSGKTTAILELVLQLVAQGKRVLLCSATHVAIDNVLERALELEKEGKAPNLLAARISRDVKKISNTEVASKYWLSHVAKDHAERTKQHLASVLDKTPGQKALETAVGNDADFEDFLLQQCNLVAGTMVGILQHPSIKQPRASARPFDYLIVDEASKVTVQSFLVPAKMAKKYVLVGDVQQLAPFSDQSTAVQYLMAKLAKPEEWCSELAQLMSDLFSYRFIPAFVREKTTRWNEMLEPLNAEQLADVYALQRVLMPSILDALQKGTGIEGHEYRQAIYSGLPASCEYAWHQRFVSLKFQHRMAEEIARFPRQQFYAGSNLLTSEKTKTRPNPLGAFKPAEPAMVWKQVQADTDKNRKQNRNEYEAKAVRRELEELAHYATANPTGKPLEVAVLTFYRGQEGLLKRQIKDFLLNTGSSLNVKLCTVDRFQGQEADAVLLCFTKWGGKPFYNVPNRLNVALTRARHKLVLFGNPAEMKGKGYTEAIQALATDITTAN